jgi:hypothetical protein
MSVGLARRPVGACRRHLVKQIHCTVAAYRCGRGLNRLVQSQYRAPHSRISEAVFILHRTGQDNFKTIRRRRDRVGSAASRPPERGRPRSHPLTGSASGTVPIGKCKAVRLVIAVCHYSACAHSGRRDQLPGGEYPQPRRGTGAAMPSPTRARRVRVVVS